MNFWRGVNILQNGLPTDLRCFLPFPRIASIEFFGNPLQAGENFGARRIDNAVDFSLGEITRVKMRFLPPIRPSARCTCAQQWQGASHQQADAPDHADVRQCWYQPIKTGRREMTMMPRITTLRFCLTQGRLPKK